MGGAFMNADTRAVWNAGKEGLTLSAECYRIDWEVSRAARRRWSTVEDYMTHDLPLYTRTPAGVCRANVDWHALASAALTCAREI